MDKLNNLTDDLKPFRVIKVEKKRVYGNDLIYVISEHKHHIETLTGKLTIDKADIRALTNLGFDIEVVAPEL